MTAKEYMKKTGVTKRKYVDEWIKKELIPGVKKDKKSGEYLFPDSARRPYRSRLKPNASATKIRASILNACLKREYISYKTYGMSKGEFSSYVNDLLKTGLIKKRIEDNIAYYDSTAKSDTCRGKSIATIRKFVVSCLKEMAAEAAYGATRALCDRCLST